MTVSLPPTVFTGHHFAQPRGQAERSREAVSAPLSGSRRLRRETLNGSSRGRSRRRRRRERPGLRGLARLINFQNKKNRTRANSPAAHYYTR